MTLVYIGVGSNIEPEKNIPEAIRLLGRTTGIRAISTFYKTEPVGPKGTTDVPMYINGVVAIDTDLPADQLKSLVLRKIEDDLGRKRTSDRYAPREIDLDILLYGDSVINQNGMIIPDPHIRERAFLAAALMELDPGLVLPDTHAPIAEIVERLGNRGMTGLAEFSDNIRKDVFNESKKG